MFINDEFTQNKKVKKAKTKRKPQKNNSLVFYTHVTILFCRQ